ncbi:alpha/beta-type small acid-soluble spore protein [Kyrpidia spormannii]|uniref:Small, acid-soluble spore protein 1 n=1 Tax=Kyrpidia spormannii TaxID=2055160 RepID=A0A6F9E3B2_9BACL|nr:alpha/beta-type small acid-soluble spore protein [Kyrpidia spormannii]CAB3390898.1 Small, acid-soluble spore protein 1 [Kyrpidia spormannii]
MARGQKRNTPVVPGALRALDQLKYEVAQELGIQVPTDGYWGTMTTRDTGAIGGNITRKLVALAEQQLASQTFGIQ